MSADSQRTGFWYRAAPCVFWCGVYLAHLAAVEYFVITKLLTPTVSTRVDKILVMYIAAPLTAYAGTLLTMIAGWLVLCVIPRGKEKERRT